MTTHFKPVNTAIQEMKPWNLDEDPVPLKLRNADAKYAVVLVMAGDDEKLGGQVLPDIGEMCHGVFGGDEISVLLLADIAKQGTSIQELTYEGRTELLASPSIDTGDPRPIAAFLAIALSSYSEQTKIALGFWGHGQGVFDDLDPHENLIPDNLIELPLGSKITETMFLANYLAEPAPVKSFFTRGMLPDGSTGGILTNRELSSALTVAFSRSGRTEPVEMIFFDTCNNGAIEIYAEMRKYCKVFVASCLSIPGLGWNYTWFLQMTRQSQPKTAQDWSRLAIAAYNKAYDQSLYPMPVQLAAIDSGAELLEKFRVVAQCLKDMDPQTRAQLMSCSNHLYSVSHNESVDVCTMVLALRDSSEDEAFIASCKDFLDSYLEGLVALSEPANDGKPYLGLSLWCPRLGDSVSVSKYYQSLRFHKETGWFDVVKEMVGQRQQKATGFAFMILSVQEPELIEKGDVEVTVIDPQDVETHDLMLHIPANSKKWSGDLEDGKYSYKNVESAVFASVDQVRIFCDLLNSIRRTPEELSAIEAAIDEDVVMDGKAAARFAYEMMKYERIVMDEFPKMAESFMIVRELFRKAAKVGLVLMGKTT
jgi:Clostripain family